MTTPTTESAAAAPTTQCGLVAIIGAPNAGKSTLLNRLTEATVAIVTPKAQTTRGIIRGIRTDGTVQIIFLDTPGIFSAKATETFEHAMVSAAWEAQSDADISVLMVDASRKISPTLRALLEVLRTRYAGAPEGRDNAPVLVLNKVDATAKHTLLELTAELNALVPFRRTFMISAERGDGVDDLLAFLQSEMPAGPWLYPDDQAADTSERALAAELTREQLFLTLRQELPYSLTVEPETWEDQPDGSVRIGQVVYVERETHKRIVLGKQGQQIKDVGTRARASIARTLQRPVHLFLFVKVRADWKQDPERRAQYGL